MVCLSTRSGGDALQPLLAKRAGLEAKLERLRAAPRDERVQRASREARRAALRSAELVMCTLSAAGGDLAALRGRSGGAAAAAAGGANKAQEIVFDAVIVDEAAQAVEAAALIPLYALEPTRARSPHAHLMRSCCSL